MKTVLVRLLLLRALFCVALLALSAALPFVARAQTSAPEVTATLAADTTEPLSGPFVVEFTRNAAVERVQLSWNLTFVEFVSGDTSAESFSIRFRPPPDFDGERYVVISGFAGSTLVAERRLIVDVDTRRPRATLALAADVTEPVTAPFGITITFDEPVTGLTPTEFTVADGEVGGVRGSGHIYTAIPPSSRPSRAAMYPVRVSGRSMSACTRTRRRVRRATATGASGLYAGMDDLTVPIARIERVSDPLEPVMEALENSIAFSEPVIGFVDGNLMAGDGGASDVGSGETVTDMSSHVTTITPNDNCDGDAIIDLAADRTQSDEPSGTGNVAAQLRVAAETAVPAPTVQRASGGTEPVTVPFDIEGTFSRNVRDFDVGDIAKLGGRVERFSRVSAAHHTARFMSNAVFDGTARIEARSGIANSMADGDRNRTDGMMRGIS